MVTPAFSLVVELDHPQDIITDLMDQGGKVLRPPFRLAKFEGDAVFFSAVTDKLTAHSCRAPSLA
jgi:hypothetical protein